MRKLMTQDTRRTSLEGANNLVWSFLWRCFDKQVDVIRLNCQLQDCPLVFVRHFFTDLAQALRHYTDQYLFAPFRYPNKVVAHLIDRVIGALQFFSFHVDSIAYVNTKSKNKRALPSLT